MAKISKHDIPDLIEKLAKLDAEHGRDSKNNAANQPNGK